ncbi:MAG: PEP-CTERM sorting domain-containing protein [Pirellulales bacterium]|nr:PEP-CTERM sorting domain-containing protein [Pirellulales bacterium]
MKFLVATKSISARDMRRWKYFSITAILLGAFLAASAASAGSITLVDSFAPLPVSPYIYEMIWTGSELYEGPGAIGTGFGTGGSGDGELSGTLQHAPGLVVQTPFVITGIPGSEFNTVSLPYSTIFFDATLDIIPTASGATMGIPAAGPAVTVGGVIIQPLGSAAFEIWSTDPMETPGPDVENPILLLAGTIESAAITCLLGSSTGSTLSADVTYSGGIILEAAELTLAKGEFSWSLLDATPLFSVDASTGYLAPFEANATGHFSAIPEPGTLVLLGFGAFGLAAYAWRKRR